MRAEHVSLAYAVAWGAVFVTLLAAEITMK
jgi:hypothetical protein